MINCNLVGFQHGEIQNETNIFIDLNDSFVIFKWKIMNLMQSNYGKAQFWLKLHTNNEDLKYKYLTILYLIKYLNNDLIKLIIKIFNQIIIDETTSFNIIKNDYGLLDSIDIKQNCPIKEYRIYNNCTIIVDIIHKCKYSFQDFYFTNKIYKNY